MYSVCSLSRLRELISMWKTRLNMAALVLAILHIIVGPAVSSFSFSAGVEYSPASASQVYFGFWSGAWVSFLLKLESVSLS